MVMKVHGVWYMRFQALVSKKGIFCKIILSGISSFLSYTGINNDHLIFKAYEK